MGKPQQSNEAGSSAVPPMAAGQMSRPDEGEPGAAPTASKEWALSKPRALGTFIGPNVDYKQDGLRLYGTDLGPSFEHDGKLVMIFGDTYSAPESACTSGDPKDDDLIGWLPLEWDGMSIPQVEVPTKPGMPTEFDPPVLYRGDEHVVLDAFKVPVVGFSDGEDAYIAFQAQAPVRCDSPGGASCPAQDGVMCSSDIPVCRPAPITVPVSCEDTQLLCLTGQCPDRQALCVDTKSSQYDGSARGIAASVLSYVDIARMDPDAPNQYRAAVSWQTNVFSHPAMRTVRKFSGKSTDNDYATGNGTLLIWGRPGLSAEEGREARIYLATHALPFAKDGQVDFKPKYFAGLDDAGEPAWSEHAGDARALALDGKPGGDPHEEIPFVGTTGISWMGAPVNRWIMMYGGDFADQLLAEPSQRSNTSIVVRLAEHPWGPWSPPEVHLAPGDPATPGDLYGPGGVLYHPSCRDTAEAKCADADPYILTLLGTCSMGDSRELGRLYAPNIIDPYTRPNDRGGLDLTWVVSTWNPYTMELFQTSVDPK